MATRSQHRASIEKLLVIAPLTAIVAALLNTFMYYIGTRTGILNTSVQVPGISDAISLHAVIIASIVATIMAAVILAIMITNRGIINPFSYFNVLAIALLLISFVHPFMIIPNITLLMGLWLIMMHCVVAGTILFAFNRFAVK